MAGIYIHIPFCRKACTYCDFHFSTSLERASEMVDAILLEMQIHQNEFKDSVIETIYFGGGTPSLLSEEQAEKLMLELNARFNVSPKAEITWEANPEDLNWNLLNFWKELGVNRLSIGVQSFNDSDLVWMNRAHNAEQSSAAITLAQKAGFDNINIDLIYAIPNMPFDQWKKNVETMENHGVQHLSAYHLTVENKTVLHHQVKTGKQLLAPDEQGVKEIEYLDNYLAQKGWQRYEISNFCKNDLFSKHNTNYWFGIPYLGLGPSAHSFYRNMRRWNVRNNAQYIDGIVSKKPAFEFEILSKRDQFNERMMVGLRTKWGVNITKMLDEFNIDISPKASPTTVKFLAKNWISINHHQITLTTEGKLFADLIASEYFVV